MSRPTLHFLRPYLTRGIEPAVKPELARAYCAFQRRFAQTIAADAYTGRHDVEKQKRLEQLRKMKSLGEFHPRLAHDANGERVSPKVFNEKYKTLENTQVGERVSVFGMLVFSTDAAHGANIARQGAISAHAGLQADVR